MMSLIERVYYALMRWRHGAHYGCGRCHHAAGVHVGGLYTAHGPCEVRGCPCKQYSVYRVKV